jgi:hypothetical protein
VWFTSKGALRVLDLRLPGTTPVLVVDVANGDFEIRPPAGKPLTSSADAVNVSLEWRTGAVRSSAAGTPAPNRAWLDAERKRRALPDRTRHTRLVVKHEDESKVSTVSFGKTGRRLAARGTSCGLLDPTKKTWSPLDKPEVAAKALSEEWGCSLGWRFDSAGKAWLGSAAVCTVAGCRALPETARAAWLDAGEEIQLDQR